jgi:hypothetical protein
LYGRIFPPDNPSVPLEHWSFTGDTINEAEKNFKSVVEKVLVHKAFNETQEDKIYNMHLPPHVSEDEFYDYFQEVPDGVEEWIMYGINKPEARCTFHAVSCLMEFTAAMQLGFYDFTGEPRDGEESFADCWFDNLMQNFGNLKKLLPKF